MADAEIYIACESGSCEIDGEPYIFVKGVTRVRKGHALLKSCPDYFVPVDDAIHYDVEQATKAPGEKRSATKTKEA